MEDSIEHSRQYSNTLFMWALIFNIALGIIGGIQGLLMYAFMLGVLDFNFYAAISQVLGIVGFPLINPLLVIIKFYKIGERTNPKISLALVARLTIVGNFVGYFPARFLIQLIIPESLILFLSDFPYILYRPFSLFFIEFTAFAIAWIKLLKSDTPLEAGSVLA